MEFGSCWQAIVENVNDGLLVVDINGKIMAVNPAIERITGYMAEDLIGKPCTILNCSHCRILGGKNGKPWCKLFEIGSVKKKECVIKNSGGSEIYLMKSGRALFDENNRLVGVVETLTDITESIQQKEEIERLKKNLHLNKGFYGITGKSPVMQKLFDLIESVAPSSIPVMINGESGTGKELVARAIHEASPRKDKPFIKVNCAALNESLLESELFGHVKGAFTGADKPRTGRFEAANHGTIFLDEIGDIPLSTQVKLLRVLEEREIERVGDHTPIPIDVRIITATNRDLKKLISKKKFREDFFFRINVFPIHCPSLNEKKEDIPILTQSFIERYSIRDKKNIKGTTKDAMDILMKYHWPGNVRELRNIIEYAMVLCQEGMISKDHLPAYLKEENEKAEKSSENISDKNTDEKKELENALEKTGWNRSKTAEILGVSRVTVWKRMKKHGLG